MLLVQQPQHPSSLSLMPPYKQIHSVHHRRNPSAPAAVVQVQPTKTPGLLSLSKPPAPRPNANLSNARHPTPRQPKARPPQIQQGPLPEKQRGRGSPARDKTARNPSKPRAGHGGRARQASPSPISSPKKAATDETVSTSVPVHPKPVPVTLPKASTPTTLLNPSGRLAKRRNRASIPFPPSASAPSLAPKDGKRSQSPPAKAKPVAVPVKSSQNSLPISRSDPVLSHIPRRNERRNVMDVFPICDDNDDDFERPSTPSPVGRKGGPVTWQTTLSDSSTDEQERGPRTAPLSSQSGMARQYFPSPVPSPEHRRAPSVPTDAMFNLSFESDNDLNLSDMSALVGRPPHRPRFDGSTRSSSTPIKKPGVMFKYASSMFQCSPSPEHLPKPKFSLAYNQKELAA
ncbi:hypothetical protein DFH11DRAFT_1517381 [Phellopilus nigrolimitatus]|nr:hypothetical protein DFH11DRAFT_1517381 [Phellopilus nigrolimitatus]